MSARTGGSPSMFSQYRALLRKDVEREFHTFDMLSSMVLYAVLVLIVYGVALSQVSLGEDVRGVASGLLWVLIVFTSLIGLNRSFAYERENDCLDAILIAPIDRSVVFLAKATSNFLFLAIVELLVTPVFVFFFLEGQQLGETVQFALVPLALGTVGMAAVGTLLATVTTSTRGRDVMLAVLAVPLLFPLLYACVCATSACLVGGDGFSSVFVPSVAIIGVYDVVMGLLSWVLYDFVVSA